MQHKGEIIEKAVRESGHSITKLAQKMGKSRRWVYQIFDSAIVPIDYIMEIGKIIHHDFTDDIKGIKLYAGGSTIPKFEDSSFSGKNKPGEVEFWKEKYLVLLEKYNDLLSKG
ncbi:MAG: putative transcriptional regulator [Crocinitomicaceae bacterium]|jgi:predicted transcriptional regulator